MRSPMGLLAVTCLVIALCFAAVIHFGRIQEPFGGIAWAVAALIAGHVHEPSFVAYLIILFSESFLIIFLPSGITLGMLMWLTK